MTKKYQTRSSDTSALAVPEQVSVVMSEITEDMREGLLALAVGTGLEVMHSLMEADVAAARRPARAASTSRTGRRCATAVRQGRSPWVAAGFGWTVPGCGPPMGPVRCRCRPMSCSLHRAAREDGDGADAGWALDAPLRLHHGVVRLAGKAHAVVGAACGRDGFRVRPVSQRDEVL